MTHVAFGHEVKTKVFKVHSHFPKRGLLECVVSCMENDCGAVSMAGDKCTGYSREEWHPEMDLDASEAVSSHIYGTLCYIYTICN